MNYDNKTPTKPPDRSSQNTLKKKEEKKIQLSKFL